MIARIRVMRILIVSRYKSFYADHQLPFVTEQGEAIRALGHEVEYFLVKGNYVKAVKPLKKKIREFKPDITHAHFGLSAITAELQSMVPVVTTFHNGETLNWRVNLLCSFFSLRAKHVIYVAQHIRDLSYFKAKNYSIIPCGVPMDQMIITPKEEARKQLGWSPDKKYILFGGAFDNERKNYKLLRDAVEKLVETKTEINPVYADINLNKEEIKNAESAVACSNLPVLTPQSACMQASRQTDDSSRDADPTGLSLHDPLQKQVDPINFDKNEKKCAWATVNGGERYGDIVCIEMKGLSRAECVLRMCAADLFALPSHSEGSPQALKEAMAVNCPCLATDIADVRELFGDEPGHWILRNPRKTHERWDGDENSLSEMMELINDALRYEGRTHGRERILALGLSNEQVAQRILEIYKLILKQ